MPLRRASFEARGVGSVRARASHAACVVAAVVALAPAPLEASAPTRPAPKVEPSPRARPRENLSSFYRSGKRSEPKPSAAPTSQRPGLFAGRNAKVGAVRAPVVTAAYRESVRHWHEASGHGAPTGPHGEACLLLVNLTSKERATLCPLEEGGFSEADREIAAHVFREPGSDNTHPVHQRLLELLLNVQEHFHSGEIRLLSGYRSPWEGNSNHGKGRAADIVVPGTSDDAAASYARGLGYVGVGIYPTSHFIHLDVRDASYFWVDASAPGRPHRERGILAGVAKESDERAKARNERRTFGPVVRQDALAWLASRGAGLANASGAVPGGVDELAQGNQESEAPPSGAEDAEVSDTDADESAGSPQESTQN
jgi:uncharacterized protein YcbK (DUF882 family)